MDQEAKQSIIARLQQANNVLVTVSTNPSVDQLAACIGFTLLMNKLGKHGTAVFSGEVPSTLEFLKPEDTLEKNTNSLRDFIIALDKAKADKLRYKVEDQVVKIFITPYRTSLSEKDLEFSQGDFNVDVVMALGVHERNDLDKAIVAHGRILHDATVISVNNRDQGNLGVINWVNVNTSSLSEMMVDLAHGLTTDALDAQMATAFMTGIVAETNRFSNEKTSPTTMTLASELMSAGANQQLIATKLAEAAGVPIKPAQAESAPAEEAETDADGSLRILHTTDAPKDTAEKSAQDTAAPEGAEQPAVTAPADLPPVVAEESQSDIAASSVPVADSATPKISKVRTDELPPKETATPEAPLSGGSNMVLEPPTLGGKLTANTEPEHAHPDPSTDPLSGVDRDRIIDRKPLANVASSASASNDVPTPTIDDDDTLTEIEEAVNSPHLAQTTAEPVSTDQSDKTENLEEAREAVDEAINTSADQPLEPIQALGAQPLSDSLHDAPAASAEEQPLPTIDPAPAPVEPLTPLVADQPVVQDQPSEPPVPYFPPNESTPMVSLGTPEPAPTPPAYPTAFGQPAAPVSVPVSAPAPAPGVFPEQPQPVAGQGIAPDVPPQLVPTTPPIDTTAASTAVPAPPPVPPPMMPATPQPPISGGVPNSIVPPANNSFTNTPL